MTTMMATEIAARAQAALASLEGGDRDDALSGLTDLVFDVALDRELIVDAMNERLKYYERRVADTVDPEVRGRWASLAGRLAAEIEKVKR